MYILPTKLMPGDIVLSSDKSITSNVISKLTNGDYSHASILVTRLLKIDATTKGIKISPISKTLKPAHSNTVYWEVDNTKKICILRLKPDLTIPANHVGNAICELALSFSGLPYSYLSKLLEVKDLKIQRKKFLSRLIHTWSLLSGNNKKSKAPIHDKAYFCSELVAAFYETLGINLFDLDLSSEHISPNSILESTKLVDVTNECITLPKDKKLLPFSMHMSNQLKKFIKLPNQFAEEFAELSSLLQLGIDTASGDEHFFSSIEELSSYIPDDLNIKLQDKKKKIISLSDDMQNYTLSALLGWPVI